MFDVYVFIFFFLNIRDNHLKVTVIVPLLDMYLYISYRAFGQYSAETGKYSWSCRIVLLVAMCSYFKVKKWEEQFPFVFTFVLNRVDTCSVLSLHPMSTL